MVAQQTLTLLEQVQVLPSLPFSWIDNTSFLNARIVEKCRRVKFRPSVRIMWIVAE